MPNVNLETDLLLNMQMLKDDLEEKYNILYTLFLSDTQKLRGAQVYYGQTDLSPNLVYVAPAEVFAQHPIACAEICQISVGPLKNHEVPACCARMEVASARWEDVFNTVLSIFVRYASWTQQLRHILSTKAHSLPAIEYPIIYIRQNLFLSFKFSRIPVQKIPGIFLRRTNPSSRQYNRRRSVPCCYPG